MSPYEVMLSESQERMLLVVSPEQKAAVVKVLEKWDLPWVEMGRVTGDRRVRIYDEGKSVADLPVKPLAHPKLYRLKGVPSGESRRARSHAISRVPPADTAPNDVLLGLLRSPNIASKGSVYRQYDHQVQTNTVLPPGAADAALLRIKGTKRGIALSTDGNGRYCYLDPYQGGAMAVAEACRNVSCVGATPIALTDCLNFGNPERPEIYYQLEWCIRGIARACRVLGVPVVSGNVSLYNETQGQAIYPTPVVGALGLLEDVDRHASMAFKREGDLVVLLGADGIRGRVGDLAGSEYLELYKGLVAGRPRLDLALEAGVQALCRRLIGEGLVSSAHDCSEGGLAVALVESCTAGGLGFTGQFSFKGRWDAAFFGEVQSRILVSLLPKALTELQGLARESQVPVAVLGVVGGDWFRAGGILDLPLSDMQAAWGGGLEEALGVA
jgi:phosphoribosylformylglycinamidine synthase